MIRRRTGLKAGGALVAAGATALGLVVSGGAASATHPTTKPHKIQGGTAYYAEGAQASPNYIFPFESLAFFSVTNINQFQFLMYRPLYWFGTGAEPTLNPSLSLAASPTYSNGDTVATINLKNYKWSNGESVTAQDVLFWMNMLKVEKYNWAGYAAGTMPDDVKSIVVNSPTKMTFTLTGPVNPYWYTYNEFSQITPMPMAWDVAAAGQKGGSQACGTAAFAAVTVKQMTVKGSPTVVPVSAAAKSCAAVWTYLSKESGYDPSNPKAPNNSLSTYSTNPLWQVVDGPWHLTAFSTSGEATFAPNKTYSGPVKPTLSKFVELPFTSQEAEFNALVAGKVQYGYIPPEDLTASTKNPLVTGPNNPRLTNYTLDPLYGWSINYFPYNFGSKKGANGHAGQVFKQLYFRQAMQYLVDQTLYNEKIFKGYGVGTYGPVPVLPKNPFASSYEKNNPYPYNAAKAVALLKSHGWDVKPGGTTTCANAAKCGVPVGTPLTFTLEYVNNGQSEQELMQAEQSSWEQAGIKISLTTASFDTVIGDALPTNPNWDLNNWGAGWIYAPDYYPTGEEIFQTGASSNSGGYSDPANDALIKDTDFKSSPSYLTQWENYLAKNLPVVFQPNFANPINEVAKNLAGALPANPLQNINPENWYFTS